MLRFREKGVAVHAEVWTPEKTHLPGVEDIYTDPETQAQYAIVQDGKGSTFRINEGEHLIIAADGSRSKKSAEEFAETYGKDAPKKNAHFVAISFVYDAKTFKGALLPMLEDLASKMPANTVLLHGFMPRNVLQDLGFSFEVVDALDTLFPQQLPFFNPRTGRVERDLMATVAASVDAEVLILDQEPAQDGEEMENGAQLEGKLYADAGLQVNYVPIAMWRKLMASGVVSANRDAEEEPLNNQKPLPPSLSEGQQAVKNVLDIANSLPPQDFSEFAEANRDIDGFAVSDLDDDKLKKAFELAEGKSSPAAAEVPHGLDAFQSPASTGAAGQEIIQGTTVLNAVNEGGMPVTEGGVGTAPVDPLDIPQSPGIGMSPEHQPSADEGRVVEGDAKPAESGIIE